MIHLCNRHGDSVCTVSRKDKALAYATAMGLECGWYTVIRL